MNTSSLTIGSTNRGQATAIRAQARQLHERLARRAGIALLAWSRRQDELRTHEAVQLRREVEHAATRARNGEFQRLAAHGSPLL